MGGPVGSRSPAIAAHVAAELGLAEPTLRGRRSESDPPRSPPRSARSRGVLSKIARDVTLLSQSEVAEVTEGGDQNRGGSSAMAHKRNPVAAVSVLACTGRTAGLVATILRGMEQEHERAAGAWQAEWGTVSDLLTLTGSATSGRAICRPSPGPPRRGCSATWSCLRAPASVEAVDPERHLDASGELIDRALAAHRR